jgi:hypothetical protein
VSRRPEDEVIDLRVRRHHQDHDLGAVADLRGRPAGPHALPGGAAHRFLVDVGAAHLEPLGDHVACHLQAHGAEADHARSRESLTLPIPGQLGGIGIQLPRRRFDFLRLFYQKKVAGT